MRSEEVTQQALEAITRIGVVALLVIWCFEIIRPFIVSIVWGVIIAVAVFPLHRKLRSLVGERANVAATVMTVALFLLIVGLFMDMIAGMVILVPILIPIVLAAGVDPVHFGIIIVLNLVIGTITPPMGIVVYVAARIGEADATAVFRAILPFFFGLLAVLGLVTAVPQISLFLPNLLNH